MDNMTREEFKNTVKRILTEAGAEVTEGNWCKQLRCDDACPFCRDKFCLSDELTVDRMFNTLEYVEQWAKEHLIGTNADKYKQVFGVEPKDVFGEFMCPRFAGFLTVKCTGVKCKDCKNEFWNSEYQEPEKEGEES